MRLPLSRKVFIVFSSLMAVTAVLGLVVYEGLRDLRRAAEEVQWLQDFQLQVEKLGAFNRGLGPHGSEESGSRFREEFAQALHLAERVGRLSRDLPEELRAGLESVPTYLGYYRAAYEELFVRYAEDGRREAESRALVAKLHADLDARVDDDTLRALGLLLRAQILADKVYHGRDLAAIGELRRLAQGLDGQGLAPDFGAGLRSLVQGAEAAHLNYLGILDREGFLRDTGARFTQVAAATIQAISRESQAHQARLRGTILGLVLLAVILTFGLWHRVTRYLGRFLADIRYAIGSIRAGQYDYGLERVPEDEFGDLAVFLRDLSGNLRETLTRLIASEEKYKRLVESLAEWVWETDPDGRFTYSSPVVETMLGWRPAEILGQGFLELLPPHEAARVARPYAEALGARRPANSVEAVLAHRDGRPVAIESGWQPVYGAQGEFLGLRGVSRDVTERRHAEEEKGRLREQLIQAQKMEAIGTLSGGVAHDFNNLLQSISGYTEMLLLGKAEEHPDYARLKKIELAADRAADLTRQLLAFSRRLESRPRHVDLNQEVRHSVELLERALPRMIEIRTSLEPELRPVWADPGQMEQVLVNLGVNARDAMPAGGSIRIETRNLVLAPDAASAAGLAPGAYVELCFADNGCGMDAATLEHIYEPFFTTKEVGKGTGLGLAMVYGIVKAHGGALACESAPGQGSKFRICLPAHDGAGPVPEPPAPPPPVRRGSETLLLVDDEELLRSLGHDLLAGAGYTVLTADSGEAALEELRARGASIDLVILDLNMPGMGGTECLRQLRALGFGGPVLIASGVSPMGAERTALQEAVQGFLRKPFRLSSLLEAVQGALHRA
ncbi:MAG: response regulator [Thermodesulfobacteriota bacterium]